MVDELWNNMIPFNLNRSQLSGHLVLVALCLFTLPGKALVGEGWVLPGSLPTIEEIEGETKHAVGFIAGAASFVSGDSIGYDFTLLDAHFGRVRPNPVGENTGWEGQWMVAGEATVGDDTSPGAASAVSVTPVVRYLFGYPASVAPFLETAFGVTWTDIAEPERGDEFQINSQARGGLYWFSQPDVAVTLQYRFVQHSTAGMKGPNGAVNIHTALIGMSYFF